MQNTGNAHTIVFTFRCQWKALVMTKHQKCYLRIDGNIAGKCAPLLNKTVNGQKLTKWWQRMPLLRTQPYNRVEPTRRGRNYRDKYSGTDTANKNSGSQRQNIVQENLPLESQACCILVILALRGLRQENGEFKANTSCVVRLSRFSVSYPNLCPDFQIKCAH